jgi:hypothetical protein
MWGISIVNKETVLRDSIPRAPNSEEVRLPRLESAGNGSAWWADPNDEVVGHVDIRPRKVAHVLCTIGTKFTAGCILVKSTSVPG